MLKKFEWTFLAFLLLLFSAFSVNWAVKGAIHFQKDVTVPDLTGKPLIEALETLSEQNLGLKKEGVKFDESVPAGTIVGQQPTAGSLVREGKIVRVTLSQGSETVFVPEVTGQSLRSAEIALRTSFLSLGEVKTQASAKYPKDTVISQSLPERRIVSKNTLVHLTVSAGLPEDGTLLMPDFVGRPWRDVESWSADLGIKAEKSEDETSDSEPGTVLSQTIPPDTSITKDTSVRFTISAKNEGSGQGPDDGTQKLSNFRFEVPQSESAKQYVFILVDNAGNREIYKGNPKPGSKLNIPLPARLSPTARIRILVNGILTEERTLQ